MKFRAALSFFTRLPVRAIPETINLSGFITYFPLVGLTIGLIVGILTSLMALLFPAYIAGLLGCFFWVAITGGLHMDGLADCGDGLTVEAPREKRLLIMKDPCVGTFGALAIIFILLIKTFTLAHLTQTFFNAKLVSKNQVFLEKQSIVGENIVLASTALILSICLASLLARSLVFIAHRAPSARPEGLGKSVTVGISKKDEKKVFAFTVIFIVLFGLISLSLPSSMFRFYHIPLAVLFGFIACMGVVSFAKKQIGGVTGDVFGCLIEVVECAVLIALCLN